MINNKLKIVIMGWIYKTYQPLFKKQPLYIISEF